MGNKPQVIDIVRHWIGRGRRMQHRKRCRKRNNGWTRGSSASLHQRKRAEREQTSAADWYSTLWTVDGTSFSVRIEECLCWKCFRWSAQHRRDPRANDHWRKRVICDVSWPTTDHAIDECFLSLPTIWFLIRFVHCQQYHPSKCFEPINLGFKSITYSTDTTDNS